MPDAKKSQLETHPLLAAIVQKNNQGVATTKFAGYVGQAQPGSVRFYSSLDDLSHYMEFDEGAVVHSEAAPETVLPNGAVSVWIKADTPVRWIREYSSASEFANMLLNSLSQSAGGPGSANAGAAAQSNS
jgi:hypothetical protein